MKNRLPSAKALLLAATFLSLARPAAAERVARFWLENTITRKTYGPILNQPGYRFQIDTEGYIVVSTNPGQVLFSAYPQTQFIGPFDLQQDRIIDLGAKAYTIIQLDQVEALVVPSEVLPHLERVPVPVVAVPSAKPETIPAEPWFWDNPSSYVVTAAWLEPFHNTKYDWTLGDREGKRASELELSRLGVTLIWGGWEGSLGLSVNGEHADSVLPETDDVKNLRLEEGSGLYASLGYVHRLQLDNRWHVMLGGVFEYRDEKYDLKATVFSGTETVLVEEAPVEGTDPVEDPAGPSFTEEQVDLYDSVSRSASLSDMALSLRGGIVYEADAWGARMELLLSVWDDTKTDGSVQVLENEFSLTGSRSHPISVSVAAWCYVFEGVWTEAKVSFGGETALRLGIGYEW